MSSVHPIIDLALAEDIGPGDVTVRYFCDPSRIACARMVSRVPCVAAGAGTAAEVFCRVDPALVVENVVADRSKLKPGDVLLDVRGSLASILTAERTALNFAQRLCAVATLTRQYVDAVTGTGCQILDTRKTTPGFRLLEKAAVVAGGGINHRIGLYDMVMVKDNHLAGGLAPAGISEGILRLKADRPDIRVEVEADTLDQVRAFYQVPEIDVILLDNMPPELMRVAVAERPAGFLLEASGGINLSTIRGVAETGVDFISVGALTHSAGSVDLSLEIVSND